MSGHKWSEAYESAITQFDKHIRRASDGTFILGAEDGKSIGVDDPVVFADLRRSLEITNRMIRDGELDPNEII